MTKEKITRSDLMNIEGIALQIFMHQIQAQTLKRSLPGNDLPGKPEMEPMELAQKSFEYAQGFFEYMNTFETLFEIEEPTHIMDNPAFASHLPPDFPTQRNDTGRPPDTFPGSVS